MAFLWKAMGFSGSIPNFPFTVESGTAEHTVVTSTLKWSMRRGISAEGGHSVTIFSCSLAQADGMTREMARNAQKRAKSLILPGFLRSYGAVEHQEMIYIATEECEPLTDVLCSSEKRRFYYGDDTELYLEGVALGLKTVAGALVALHQNELIHGNVCCESVYVTRSGMWRLFGVELVSSHRDESTNLLSRYGPRVLPDYRRPPEMQVDAGGRYASLEVGATDAWGLACLIYETLGVPPSEMVEGRWRELRQDAKASDLRSCSRLPSRIRSVYTGLGSANPAKRCTVARFLETCDFVANSEYVKCMTQLEELSLMDVSQRERFMEHLEGVIDTFPLRVCVCYILQKLSESLQIGTGASVVSPLIKIAARVTDQTDIDTSVVRALLLAYQSPDRLVRYRLLQHADVYGCRISPNVLNEKLWPLYVSGFSSPTPNVREYSARALVHFAPNLSSRIMDQDVSRYLAKLQQDADGAIRTNATICLCLVAERFSAEGRATVLVTGFGRMLKDPFVPSRAAALRGLKATLHHMTVKQLAGTVLPAVSPLTVDAAGEVRTGALAILQLATARLSENHAEMLKTNDGDAQGAKPSAAGGKADGAEDASALLHPVNIVSTSTSPMVAGPSPVSTTCSSAASTACNTEARPLYARPKKSEKVSTCAVPTSSDWNDGDDDGWDDDAINESPTTVSFPRGVAPSASTASQSSLALRKVPSFGHYSTKTSVASSGSTGGKETVGTTVGAMKLRKKAGLGASPLHYDAQGM